jgi:CheY-like chemotaxis protein
VLETIAEILDEAVVETSQDFETAAKMLADRNYDLAILDVMGVDGLTLLDICVEKGIPAAIFTAHAMNVQTFQKVIEKGAVSFIPKERMADLHHFASVLIADIESGKEPWKILFDELAGYFDQKFGPSWKEANKEFWDEFTDMIKDRFSADRR